jgi:2-iminobutanoate/2-iminopropanoate deaminase
MSTATARPIPNYSLVRKAGDHYFVSGAIGVNPATGEIAAGGIEAEVHQTLRNIAAALQSVGLAMDDIVKTTVFVTNFNFYRQFNDIYRSYFSGELPARATVGVANLLLGASIEIEAVAWRSRE